MSSTNLSGKLAVALGTGYKLGRGHFNARPERETIERVESSRLTLAANFGPLRQGISSEGDTFLPGDNDGTER